MALPYEIMSVEERSQERAARTRRRETWPRDNREQQLTYSMAIAFTTEREHLEDALVELANEAEGPFKARQCTVLRQSIRRLSEQYKKVEVAVKYGWETAEEVFGQEEAIEGLSETQAKTLRNYLKRKRSDN